MTTREIRQLYRDTKNEIANLIAEQVEVGKEYNSYQLSKMAHGMISPMDLQRSIARTSYYYSGGKGIVCYPFGSNRRIKVILEPNGQERVVKKYALIDENGKPNLEDTFEEVHWYRKYYVRDIY